MLLDEGTHLTAIKGLVSIDPWCQCGSVFPSLRVCPAARLDVAEQRSPGDAQGATQIIDASIQIRIEPPEYVNLFGVEGFRPASETTASSS
jgi:hypothetical protein